MGRHASSQRCSTDAYSTRALLMKVVHYAAPSSVNQLINYFSMMASVVFLAHLGHMALAASALISVMTFTVILFCSGILMALGPVLAQLLGRGDKNAVSLTLQSSLLLALLLSVLIMGIYTVISPLLLGLGQEPQLVAITVAYFHVFTWAIPGLLVTMVLRQFLQVVGLQYGCMLSSFFSLMVMVILGYGFTFGRLGLPALGVQGVALANVVLSYVNVLLMLVMSLTLKGARPFKPFRLIHGSRWQALGRVWRVGWSIAAQMASEMLAIKAGTLIVGLLGVGALAASQVAGQWLVLVFVILFGIQQAVSILVGQSFGAGESEKLHAVNRFTIIIALVFSLVAALLLVVLRDPLVMVYMHQYHHIHPHTLHLALTLMWINAVIVIPEGQSIVLSGSLRGINDANYPMRVSFIKFWVVYIPLGSLMAFPLHWGVVGMSLGFLSTSFVSWYVLHRRWHQQLVLIDNPQATKSR